MQVVAILLAICIFSALLILIIFLLIPTIRLTKTQPATIPLPTKTKMRYDIEYYMREFIQPYTLSVQKKIATLGLEGLDDDTKALRIYNFLIANLDYEYEDERDFWQTPAETLTLGFGNSYDLSLLLASLLICAGIKPDKVRVVLGKVYGKIEAHKIEIDTKKRTKIDHSWVIYVDKNNKWRLLECVQKEPVSELPLLEEYYNGGYYIPEYIFNNMQGWQV